MITMYDAIYVANLEPPPPHAQAYAGYVDGRWPDYFAIKAAYPRAHLLSIAVFPSDDAEALDIENGDATPAQAPAWVKRQHARGVKRPVCYASADAMIQVWANLQAAGIARTGVRLWSAHYGAGEHICGGGTCGYKNGDGHMVPPCDGTQWDDGAKYDTSILLDSFFEEATMYDTPPAPPGKWPHGAVLTGQWPDGAAWVTVWDAAAGKWSEPVKAA